jgi:putative acetyltransferase
VQIRAEPGLTEPIRQLLQEHLANMQAITPPESTHALDDDAMTSSELTYWSAWDDEQLVGCGALKRLDTHSGEVKAMRTTDAARGRGIGRAILEAIIGEARRRGYASLMLETGSMDAFIPARTLYASHGFAVRGPFGNYVEDPNSVCMELTL